MKGLFAAVLIIPSLAWSIPSEITYQGTLKEKGVPVNGTRTMIFRITNEPGTQVYWSSGDQSVDVVNGLFSRVLTPTNVDWQAVKPYMEVSVNGQQLSPREPLNTSVYAQMSASIVDGAITPNKVASGYGLVPSGAIMMFTTSCPSGWTRFSELDNRFPVGGSNYGITGGSDTHKHTVNIGNHTHPVDDSTLKVGIGIRNIGYDNNLVMQPGGSVGGYSQSTANQWYGYGSGLAKPSPVGTNPTDVSVQGPKVSGSTGKSDLDEIVSSSQSNLPPYVTVVFCKK